MIDKASSFYNLIENAKIVVPIIQRDYAQGRENEKVAKIRSNFLDALFHAIKNPTETIELDFIYGYNKGECDDRFFVPLDGQQRLTTLFLLHWYAGIRENKEETSKHLLNKFTYEVRHSSKVFCESLVNFKTSDHKKDIKEIIVNQSWFFTEWHNDPTIASMLVMLSAIQNKYDALKMNNVWDLLISENSPIRFYCLPMEKLGLEDSLYIKMNSRGKPLTDFEHFKSQFSGILPANFQQEFNDKIDTEWSDLFWKLHRKQDSKKDLALQMDEGILHYFAYITDILIAKKGLDVNEIELLKKCELIYSKDKENVQFLFNSLNAFAALDNTSDFFNKFFYVKQKDFSKSKVRLYFRNTNNDLLHNCVTSRGAAFTFGEKLMLYAVIIHELEKTENFCERIRILRNLIENSEDEMRTEFYKEFLETTYSLIKDGALDEKSKFNTRQVLGELQKQDFLKTEFRLKERLYKLEDHVHLKGNLALFDLDDSFESKATAFMKIFSKHNHFELISRALLTFGNYAKNLKKSVYDYGANSNHWRLIFTPSRNFDFTETKNSVNLLLEAFINGNTDLEKINRTYLKEYSGAGIAKPFEYYFIKYNSFLFHPEQNGYYCYAHNWQNSKYELYRMNRLQFNGKHWSPFLVSIKENVKKVTLDDYGFISPLTLNVKGAKFMFMSHAKGYSVEISNGKNAEKLLDSLMKKYDFNDENVLLVEQNAENIDIEDRIEKGINMINYIIKTADKL